MNFNTLTVPLIDFILCLSSTMDLISPELVNHHKRVAYMAYRIAEELGLSDQEQITILFAGLLHDTGALYLEEKEEALQFDFENDNQKIRYRHGYVGYLLLRSYGPFAEIAKLVKYHHVYWNEVTMINDEIPLGCHILHLADRIDVLINPRKEILGQVKEIIKRIEQEKNKMFAPQGVEAFKNIAIKESFWMDVTSNFINSLLAQKASLMHVSLDIKEISKLAELFYKIIDFRSTYTATHSIGVAASAEALAKYYGYKEKECQMMRIAGLLHDMGKLAVPTEILEKPAGLSEHEINIIKSHAYYSCRILGMIKELNIITEWAAYHHEHLDGSGYPFHLKGDNISLGSRIMAVADVFTAVTEDRPYRKAMKSQEAVGVLEEMVRRNHLDKGVVSLLKQNFDDINSLRIMAQTESYKEYLLMGQKNSISKGNKLINNL